MAYKDKTSFDDNRIKLDFHRAEIDNVLPEYFAEEYPKLKQLFEAYYEWMDSEVNPSGKIARLYESRDATQTPADNLPFLEDELLLGQSYFGGFQNKREAIKFSNLLYRSKGTKYSIEQFFRGFYGVDPVVAYPKENVFKVGPEINFALDSANTSGQQISSPASKIGAESQRFITDDKLYQVMSLLIRVGVSVNEWRDVYKLFVHPGGMYLGSELLIEVINENALEDQLPNVDALTATLAFTVDASLQTEAFISQTLLVDGDTDYGMHRQNADQFFDQIGNVKLEDAQGYHLEEMLDASSATFDDSDDPASVFRTAATFDEEQTLSDSDMFTSRFDEGKFNTLFDSENSADSADYTG
tara:strand:+ start:2320 stop:3390 length:1071 start_codon:yes stop_codon:yes gene_type:complete